MFSGFTNTTSRGKQRIPKSNKPGSSVFTSDAVPTDDVGVSGDVVVNTNDWSIHGPKSDTWVDSPVRSVSKTRIFFDPVSGGLGDNPAPPIDKGFNGDVWIFTNVTGNTLNFWQKIEGTWTQMLSFVSTSVNVASTGDGAGGDSGGDGGGGE